MHAPVDDLYLNVVLRCAHEQNAHSLQWVVSIGVANKNAVFAMLVGLAKRFEAQRSSGGSGGGGWEGEGVQGFQPSVQPHPPTEQAYYSLA